MPRAIEADAKAHAQVNKADAKRLATAKADADADTQQPKRRGRARVDVAVSLYDSLASHDSYVDISLGRPTQAHRLLLHRRPLPHRPPRMLSNVPPQQSASLWPITGVLSATRNTAALKFIRTILCRTSLASVCLVPSRAPTLLSSAR